MEEELTCSVCLNFFLDPVLLNCCHSLCYGCVAEIHFREKKKQITCPLCCDATLLPKGLKGLKRNFTLANIINHYMNPKELNFKVIILGSTYVGKTCLVERLINNSFTHKVAPTLPGGCGPTQCKFNIKGKNSNSMGVELQIWDTAGQERFNAFTKQYIRGAAGIIFVYDTTNTESLHNLTNIKQFYFNDTTDYHSITKILIGTKDDLVDKKQVSTYEAEQKQDELDAFEHFETSSLSDHQVRIAFTSLARELLHNYESQKRIPKKDVNIITLHKLAMAQQINKPSKSTCCPT